jgi:hypothetical protein
MRKCLAIPLIVLRMSVYQLPSSAIREIFVQKVSGMVRKCVARFARLGSNRAALSKCQIVADIFVPNFLPLIFGPQYEF